MVYSVNFPASLYSNRWRMYYLPHEIDKERGVILEEYNMYQDTPMYQVGWDFEKLLFGDQPMGWIATFRKHHARILRPRLRPSDDPFLLFVRE